MSPHQNHEGERGRKRATVEGEGEKRASYYVETRRVCDVSSIFSIERRRGNQYVGDRRRTNDW